MKVCADCKHVYRWPEQVKWPRCARSVAEITDPASLAGEMRKGVCGPEAALWEAKDGQA
jgi:hypothetical protein